MDKKHGKSFSNKPAINELIKLSKLRKEAKTVEEKSEIFKQMRRVQTFGINSLYGAYAIPDTKLLKTFDIDNLIPKKLFAIVKIVYVEFDNSIEIGSQYYKTPIIETFIEGASNEIKTLEDRLNDIKNNYLSLVINDTFRWLEDKIKRPVINAEYEIKDIENGFKIEFTTKSYFNGEIKFQIRQIEIK